MSNTQITRPNQIGESKYCPGCGIQLHKTARSCPSCGAVQQGSVGNKSRTTATVLAFLLGGIGAHKFYLGRVGTGILYLLFCWTFIPAFISFVEFIIYLTMTDEAFSAKYG